MGDIKLSRHEVNGGYQQCIDAWAKCSAEAISKGSQGQTFYFAQDALSDIATLSVALAAKDAELSRLRAVLGECEDYFANRADADCEQDGFIPNEEMVLLSAVRGALNESREGE